MACIHTYIHAYIRIHTHHNIFPPKTITSDACEGVDDMACIHNKKEEAIEKKRKPAEKEDASLVRQSLWHEGI